MSARKKPFRRRTGLAYETTLKEVVGLVDSARRASARSINAIMTATYWAIGRHIVELAQHGAERAGYGEELIVQLSRDLQEKFKRGFGRTNLFQMRAFYLEYRELANDSEIVRPVFGQSSSKKVRPLVGQSEKVASDRFPLPWSHYQRLLPLRNASARAFYEAEALRGGWTRRQLERQIATQFYERTALSKNKARMLTVGAASKPDDAVTPEEEIKDPFVLEFLGLKDEYSETDLEDALIHKLESFLMELGGDFAFVGRQRRLRVGAEWYRVDLVFFHRRLRCLVVIDLKLGKFTHADAGQMHLYVNYAREHWSLPGENPAIGLVLCAAKDTSVAHYALDGLPSKVVAAEYRTVLPTEELLVEAIEQTRRQLETRERRRRS